MFLSEWPSPLAEQKFLQKLLSGDPTATADLFVAYYTPLFNWLQINNRSVDEQMNHDAATEALSSLMKNPQSYKPEMGKRLKSYLMMSAAGDLKNLLRREKRHQFGRKSFEDVELGDGAGNTTSSDLELHEEVEWVEATILVEVKRGLTLEELAGLDVYLADEKSTEAFAAVLRLDVCSAVEREAAVKRFKDKIKLRIKRARGLHDEPS